MNGGFVLPTIVLGRATQNQGKRILCRREEIIQAGNTGLYKSTEQATIYFKVIH
jgi:hypothetical protein